MANETPVQAAKQAATVAESALVTLIRSNALKAVAAAAVAGHVLALVLGV